MLGPYRSTVRREEDFLANSSSSPPLGAFLLKEAGAKAYEDAKMEEAARFFSLASTLVEHHGVLTSLGMTLTAQGKEDEALLAFKRAVSLSPQDLNSLLNLGSAYERSGRWDEALQEYRKAVEASPRSPEPLAQLAHMLRRMGKVEEASRSFNETLKLLAAGGVRRGDQQEIRMQARAFYGIGLILADALDQQEEALAYLSRAAGMQHFDQSIQLEHARLLLRRMSSVEDAQRAADILRKLLSEEGDDKTLEIRHLYLYANLSQGIWKNRDASLQAIIESSLRRAASNMTSAIRADMMQKTHMDADIAKKLLESHAKHQLSLPHLKHAQPYKHQELGAILFSSQKQLRVGYVLSTSRENKILQLLHLFSEHKRRGKLQSFYIPLLSTGSQFDAMIRSNVSVLDLSGQPSLTRAAKINEQQLHVLISTSCWADVADMPLFALSPAAVQLSFMCDPMTTGAPYFHGIVSDRVATPPELSPLFSEKLLLMPSSHRLLHPLRHQQGGAFKPEHRILANFAEMSLLDFDALKSMLKTTKSTNSTLLLSALSGQHMIMKIANKLNMREGSVTFITTTEASDSKGVSLLLSAQLFSEAQTDIMWQGVPAISVPGKDMSSRIAASVSMSQGDAALIVRNDGEHDTLARKLLDRKGYKLLQHTQDKGRCGGQPEQDGPSKLSWSSHEYVDFLERLLKTCFESFVVRSHHVRVTGRVTRLCSL